MPMKRSLRPCFIAFSKATPFMRLILAALVVCMTGQMAQAQFSFSVPQSLNNQTPAGTTTLSLMAVIEGTQTVLKDGLTWRIYDSPAEKRAALITSSKDANPRFDVPPGAYIIHVSYGLASASRRIIPIPNDRVTFNVYVAQGSDPEGRLVAENILANKVLYLPSGLYRVVSRYGRTNAIATADLRIDSGVLSQATLTHRAATVTLKLVRAKGAEALGGTRFSVLTPGGDIVREISGAFPTLTLAEGEYLILARNGGKLYSEDAVIKSGFDRDIEVLTTNVVNTDENEPAKKQ